MPLIKYVGADAKCMICGKPCVTSDPCYCAEHSSILITYKCLICGKPCLGHNRFCCEEHAKQGEVILQKNHCSKVPMSKKLEGFIYKCPLCGNDVPLESKRIFCTQQCHDKTFGGFLAHTLIGDIIEAKIVNSVKDFINKKQSGASLIDDSTEITEINPSITCKNFSENSIFERRCHDCGKPTYNYRCRDCYLKWKIENKLGLTDVEYRLANELNLNVGYQAEHYTDDIEININGVSYRAFCL